MSKLIQFSELNICLFCSTLTNSRLIDELCVLLITKPEEHLGGNCLQARGKLEEKLKFPGKNDAGRPELEGIINRAGKWEELSELDTTSLVRIVESGLWNKDLIDRVMNYGRPEAGASLYISKLKDDEK